MVANVAFESLLLGFLLGGLHFANHGFASASHQFIARTFKLVHQLLAGIFELLVVSAVDLVGLLLGLGEVKLVGTVLLDAILSDVEVADFAVQLDVHIRLDAPRHLLLLGGLHVLAVFFFSGLHKRGGYARPERLGQLRDEDIVRVP